MRCGGCRSGGGATPHQAWPLHLRARVGPPPPWRGRWGLSWRRGIGRVWGWEEPPGAPGCLRRMGDPLAKQRNFPRTHRLLPPAPPATQLCRPEMQRSFCFQEEAPGPPSFSGVGVDVCVFWGWGSGDHSAPGRASSFSEVCVGASHCKPEASGAPVSPSVDWGYNFSQKGVCGNKRRWLTQCREESELMPSFF